MEKAEEEKPLEMTGWVEAEEEVKVLSGSPAVVRQESAAIIAPPYSTQGADPAAPCFVQAGQENQEDGGAFSD